MADDTLQNAIDDAKQSLADMQDSANAAVSDGGVALDPGALGIEMLGDVELEVSIELGRTEMLVEDVLKLGSGSVVELDKLAGDPVDVFVNGRLIARGEVLVLNDNFCIRISEIVDNVEEQTAAAVEQAAAAEAG